MNRFVSLLLVALSLAAVTLAQPAHAQWVKGQAYYSSQDATAFSHDANTTHSTTGVGDMTLTSISPGGRYSSINTAGSYNNTVNQPYTWTGASSPVGTSFVYSDTYAVSGSCTGAGSANSNVGSGFYGTTANPDPSTPGQYGKQGGSGNITFINSLNVNTITFQVSIGVGTSASNGGVGTGNANITFSAPS